MSPRLLLLRFLRRWHARIGCSAMLFFLLLAVTGFVLNHGSDLGLDAKYVHLSWLARWYGIEAELPHQAFRSGRHHLVAANGRWLLDGRTSGDKLPQPVGLVALPDMVVVASGAALHVYRDDGELIDRLGAEALPGVPVQAIGSSARELVLRTASGTYASTDALSWTPAPRKEVAWSAPAELSAVERQAYERALAPGVAVQRLLLDLHSGRFAGRYGPFVVDFLGVLLAVLSLSGAWLFFMPRHRRGRH
jgi:hypothetical protein